MASGGFLATVFWFLLPFVPIILVAYYVHTAYQTWLPLRHIPGPFLGKFSYLFLMKTQRSGVQHLKYKEIDRKYGTLAYLDDPKRGINIILV